MESDLQDGNAGKNFMLSKGFAQNLGCRFHFITEKTLKNGSLKKKKQMNFNQSH